MAMPMSRAALVAAALLLVPLVPAEAGSTWDGIRSEVWGTRQISTAQGVVALDAPYRPDNVMRVPLKADITVPAGETIKTVSFVVDENPSPVAAVVTLGGDRQTAKLSTYIRLNQQSDVRVVVETGSGELFMAERLVKFAGGQASCSAPPQGDPQEIVANMGKMHVAYEGPAATASHQTQAAKLEINHPNHTGMVLDQITLHYIPLLMVDRIEVKQGDEVVLTAAGSITLSQNPTIDFDFVTNGASELTITARDTSGAEWRKSVPVGPAS
ncbi:MAG: quinoprotein dehydrogenase-associated SoxYZ-like carrier [Hyphomicrobium sp.]|nr:quinoprotein dehydrogenase-associated SoxYZ-like carrier [Hyphomicrobium sp.]